MQSKIQVITMNAKHVAGSSHIMYIPY